MEQEFTLNSADYVECYYESSKETSSTTENSSDESKPIIEVKWLLNNTNNNNGRIEINKEEILLNEEIKTEHVVLKNEDSKVGGEEKIEENSDFAEESGRKKTENSCEIIKVKEEYETLQCVKEENELLQCVKEEEITMECGVSDKQDFMKNETVEGKL